MLVLQDMCWKLVQTAMQYAAQGVLDDQMSPLGLKASHDLIVIAAKVFGTFQPAAATDLSLGKTG